MFNYIIRKKGRVGYIEPIPKGLLANLLEKEMMYIKQGAQFMPNPLWAQVKMYKIHTGRFAWGLIDKVKKVLTDWTKNNQDTVTIKYPKNVADVNGMKTLNPKLRDYQKDAILQLLLNDGGILCLPTGAGKTFTAIEYMKVLNVPTLVIVHTLDLKDQWKKQVPDFCDVINYHAIKDKEMLKKYKLFVFDECHRVASKTIYNIAMKTGNSILIGCSATPYREDGEDMKIQAALGEIVFRIDRKYLIDQGFLSDAVVYYLKLNNHNKDRFYNYQEMYKEMIVDNNERNMEIVKIAMRNLDKKVLILVSQIEHGNLIQEALNFEKIKSLFLHGNVKDRDPKDNNIVIATSIFDEGVDIPEFSVLILAAGGKSSIRLVQRVGRVLRKHKNKDKAIVYDFMDKSRYLREHYINRRRILEEDFEVIEL